jgi:hypothetical protein
MNEELDAARLGMPESGGLKPLAPDGSEVTTSGDMSRAVEAAAVRSQSPEAETGTRTGIGPDGQTIDSPEAMRAAIGMAATGGSEVSAGQPPLTKAQIDRMNQRRHPRALSADEIQYINSARARGIHLGA